MPFIDEKMSNINDSRAYPKLDKLNESNLSLIANVFENINPIEGMSKNINKVNESLIEAE